MGVFAATVIITLWASHLYYSLAYVEVNFSSSLFYMNILIQGYLFTGLFITAHDAMHGTVSRNSGINAFIGRVSTFLFAGLSYDKLLKNHKLHHFHPGTDKDPDYCTRSRNFFVWFVSFFLKYVSVWQIVIVGIIFNLLKIFFAEPSIWFFYVIPAFLGTLQLFYFGTYRPHRLPHTHDMQPHNSRTMKTNHVLAMLSCYFFGYHSEHHAGPHIPWWQLYKTKH